MGVVRDEDDDRWEEYNDIWNPENDAFVTWVSAVGELMSPEANSLFNDFTQQPNLFRA